MTDSIQVIRWEELSANQQRVLTSAMEDKTLNWIPSYWAASEDANYNNGRNNRGRVYAQALIAAADELIRMGIVGVATSDPDLRILSERDALSAIRDINNWWRYQSFADLDDPLDSGPDPTGHVMVAGDWRSDFALTQVNQDRITIDSWESPSRMGRLLE